MFDGELSSNIAKAAGALTFAVVGIAFGIQKVLKSWNSDSAENKVVLMMREELERANKQNTSLSEVLNRLQNEIIKLNESLLTLTVENQKLHREVSDLNTQVEQLKASLNQGTK